MHLEIYSFIFFIVAFRYVPSLQIKNVSVWSMPVIFIVKVGIGIVFLMIYLQNNTNNSLPSDTMRFLAESRELNNVFYKSPKDYFSLLCGINSLELGCMYLRNTEMWDVTGMKYIIDSRSMIRLNSVIYFWSNGSPYIHMLFMCFFSTIGIKQIYLAISTQSVQRSYVLLSSIVFLPSVLFWTSGVVKEPILFLGIGLFLRSVIGLDSKKKKILLFISSVFVLLNFKFYVLICAILALAFYLVYKYIVKHRIVLSVLICLSIAISCVFLFDTFSARVAHRITVEQFQFNHIGKGGLYVKDGENYYYFKRNQYKKLSIDTINQTVKLLCPTKITIYYHRNYYPTRYQQIEPTGEKWKIDYFEKGAVSYIETTPINNSRLQLIMNIPEALLNSILRPFPGDPGSSLMYISMFEVWIVLAFLVYAYINKRKMNNDTKGIVISILVFAFFLFLVIGWTTPVIGAIFRYRFPAELALVLIGLIMLKSKKEVISLKKNGN